MDRLFIFRRPPDRAVVIDNNGSGSSRPRPWVGCVLAGFAAISIVAAAGSSRAGSPHVQFDVTERIGCRDITPQEFAASNPDERLLEARFRVSSLVQNGRDGELIQYLYYFENPAKSLEVVDFLPKTTLASDVAGNVGVEKKDEKLRHLGLTLSGQYDGLLNVSGGGDANSKSNSSVRYELLPPMNLVAASGTLRRGSGVYFKLKPSPQTSLEGAKEFVVDLRASASWRGDYVVLRCTALGSRCGGVLPIRQSAVCGEGRFVVALYAEGDESAKEAAERLGRAELQLRRMAVQHRKEIVRHAYPTLASKMGGLLDVVPPQIPDYWLERLLLGPGGSDTRKIVERLPREVRQAAEQYLKARRRLQSLNGIGPQLARLGAL